METCQRFTQEDQDWMKGQGVEEIYDDAIRSWRWIKELGFGKLGFNSLPTSKISCNIVFVSKDASFTVGAQAKTAKQACELAFKKLHHVFSDIESFIKLASEGRK